MSAPSNFVAPPTDAKTVPGLGTQLQIGSAPVSPTWSTLAHRVTIDGPDMKVGEAEKTHLDSTAKEFRPTLPEAGTVSLTIWYDPNCATHGTLTNLMITPQELPWRLVFADGKAIANSMIAWTGFLTGFKVGGMDEEGNLSADVTIRIDGPIAFTVGS